MKKLLIALVFTPSLAFAQTIHNHPQKAAYSSPAEWPFIDAQCHYLPINNPPSSGAPILAHLHLGLKAPYYAEINSSIIVPFTIKMFKWNGTLPENPIWGRNIRDVVFDVTNTATPPIRQGDPNGLIEETGHLTIDPMRDGGWGPFPLHGWAQTFVAFDGNAANGTRLEVQHTLTFWSIIDPSAPPLGNSEGGFPTVGSKCQNMPYAGNQLGANATEFLSEIPLLPFNTPYPLAFRTYAYGMDNSPELSNTDNLAEISLDANIHMGIEGTQIFQRSGKGTDGAIFFPDKPYLLDPSLIGSGNHNLLFRWELMTGNGTPHFQAGQQIWALVTLPVNIADGVPNPPPTDPCKDSPLVINVDVTGNFPISTWNGTVTATDNRSCSSTISR